MSRSTATPPPLPSSSWKANTGYGIAVLILVVAFVAVHYFPNSPDSPPAILPEVAQNTETEEPTHSPSEPPPSPTRQPTDQPTTEPTDAPTQAPTIDPTVEPTVVPTHPPTATFNPPTPTTEPTARPTAKPTAEPTSTTLVQTYADIGQSGDIVKYRLEGFGGVIYNAADCTLGGFSDRTSRALDLDDKPLSVVRIPIVANTPVTLRLCTMAGEGSNSWALYLGGGAVDVVGCSSTPVTSLANDPTSRQELLTTAPVTIEARCVPTDTLVLAFVDRVGRGGVWGILVEQDTSQTITPEPSDTSAQPSDQPTIAPVGNQGQPDSQVASQQQTQNQPSGQEQPQQSVQQPREQPVEEPQGQPSNNSGNGCDMILTPSGVCARGLVTGPLYLYPDPDPTADECWVASGPDPWTGETIQLMYCAWYE